MFNLGAVVAHVKADISDFQSKMSKVRLELDSTAPTIKKVSDGINKAISDYGKIAVTAGAAGAILFGKKAIDEAAQYEQQVIALTTLLGDQAKAQEHIARIKSDALKTPFDVSGLITANQLLISAGVNADQAETDILNLGDAISANGKGAVELDRIVVNLQQIKNVGSATEMDMKQFAFNGINMYQLLADSTNLPIEKLKDMEISYDMISGALAKASAEGGKYHNANLRQSESLIGLKSNLGDTIQQQLINIANTTGMFDAAKLVTGELTKWIVEVTPGVTSALQGVGKAIVGITSFINEHKTAVEIAAGTITLFFIPAIIATGVQSGIAAAIGMAQMIQATIAFGLEGWKVVSMLLVKIVQLGLATAAFVIHTIATVAQTAAQIALTTATWLFNAAMLVLTSPIFLVVAAIAALIAIGYLLITNWDKVKEFGKNMLDFLVGKFNGFVITLKDVGNRVLDAIMWPFNEAKKRIEEAVNWIKDRLDFTKRHSPSVLDIVKSGVSKVNDALGELSVSTSVNHFLPNSDIMPNVQPLGVGVSPANRSVSINLDLKGAIISSDREAQRFSKMVGNNIVKSLQANVRF